MEERLTRRAPRGAAGADLDLAALSGRQILLDCRWLGRGGAGRATQLLLTGLQQLQPPGRWLLWGPEAVAGFCWAGSRHLSNSNSPRARSGQGDLLHVPAADLALYMHQIRPLRPGRSITLMHDTIPLHHGGRSGRMLKRLFFLSVAHSSARILTDSRYSKRSIERDLWVAPHKVEVVPYPVDLELVRAVTALRPKVPPRESVLYVGRFAPHKNLDRLMLAFGHTDFARGGGELLLVGGEPARVEVLGRFAARHRLAGVRIEGPCSEARLHELYASCRLLVMPSLEEGFGLPALEAMACGLRVAVSDGGSLPEVVGALVPPFPARSVAAMARAIDTQLERPVPALDLSAWPREIDFARVFLRAAAAICR